MNANIEAFQQLLAKMRDEFLQELPERCDNLESLILALEKHPANRQAFNELYRSVHSLKGSGGTHGLSIITTLCHLLENHLTETDVAFGFNDTFASRALNFVDLLRRVQSIAQQGTPNYSSIEADIEVLRQAVLHSRKIVLVAEASPVMARFYQQALAKLPLHLYTVDNGLAALERLLHEHYDFIIAGREIKDLNGIAMIVALRASQSGNQNIPAILVSSSADPVPAHTKLYATILRDQHLAKNLTAVVQELLKT